MKTNPNDAAHPSHKAMEDLAPNTCDSRNRISGGGLTKREYFAALALQASVSANDHANPSWMTQETAAQHAHSAVLLADTLISKLNHVEINKGKNDG